MAPTNQQAKAARVKLLAGGKQPKARVARYLKSRESKLSEGPRVSLLLKGIRCSQSMGVVLKDLRSSLAPNCKLLNKNNAIVPFDTTGQQSLEFLSTKNDATVFCIASTNKKRPNNLTIGRTFDSQILDMAELGILRYKSISDYDGTVPKKRVGSKPLMLFCGDLWQHDSECTKLQNMLIDLYKGDPSKKVYSAGLDHIMVFTCVMGPDSHNNNNSNDNNIPKNAPLIHQRTYHCKLKKNPRGGTVPVPLLTPCGPDMDFTIRRTQMAAPDLWKAALKQPQGMNKKKKKVKNQSTNIFGERIGRLHLEKQDLDARQGKKVKALRRAEKATAEEEKKAVESELAQEKQELGQEFKQLYGFEEEDTDKRRSSKFGSKK
jgi:ribosome production factor 2